MTLVAVWANAAALNASSRKQIDRRRDTVDTSRVNQSLIAAVTRTIHPERILVHDLVPAAGEILVEEALEDVDFDRGRCCLRTGPRHRSRASWCRRSAGPRQRSSTKTPAWAHSAPDRP